MVFDGCLHSHGACFLWHDARSGWPESVLVRAGAGKPISKPALAKTSVQAPATDRVASAIRRLEIEKHVGASQTWSVAAKHGPWQTT
jgi:hypothetical protein